MTTKTRENTKVMPFAEDTLSKDSSFAINISRSRRFSCQKSSFEEGKKLLLFKLLLLSNTSGLKTLLKISDKGYHSIEKKK